MQGRSYKKTESAGDWWLLGADRILHQKSKSIRNGRGYLVCV